MELQTHLMGRSGKGTFGCNQPIPEQLMMVSRYPGPAGCLVPELPKGQNLHKSLYLQSEVNSPSLRIWQETIKPQRGAFWRREGGLGQMALLSAACCTFTLKGKGWEGRGLNSLLQRTGQAAGNPGQGSVSFDASVMGGIPKDLCHFNMVPGTQADHEWLSDDGIH